MNVEIDVTRQSDFLIQSLRKKSLAKFADRKISIYRKQRDVPFYFLDKVDHFTFFLINFFQRFIHQESLDISEIENESSE
jgi:hypothetical protein